MFQGGRAVLKQAGQPFSLPGLQVSGTFDNVYMKLVYGIGATRRGDVLAVFLENRPEYVGLLLGLSKVLHANMYK